MSSKDDYIPINDSDLSHWLSNFSTVVNARLGELGLTAADVAFLPGMMSTFDDCIAEQARIQQAAVAATCRKRCARADLEEQLRPLVRRINAYPNTSNEVRSALGLSLRKDYRSRRNVGTEAPALELEGLHGRVVVHFGTLPSNERLNGKPKWATGCNIYRRKAGEENFRLVAFCTSSPYSDPIPDEAVTVSYYAEYRGVRPNDRGGHSLVQTIAAGTGSSQSVAGVLREAA